MSAPAPSPRRRGRPWTVYIVLAATVGALIWIQLSGGDDRQARYLRGFLICLIAALVLGIHWLLRSRRRWQVRLLGLTGAMLAAGLVAVLFRIEGVTGDLVPIVRWRWTSAPRAVTPAAATPAVAGATATNRASEAAWPQFLGPQGNGILAGPALASDWSQSPPAELWRIAVGPGWAGFAVADGIAVTQEQDGPRELVTAFDSATGRRLWQHADEARYATTIAGEGPRATPTIVGGRVYTAGATGRLNCLELHTGAPLWSRDVLKENGGTVPEWGFSASPLVLEDLVVLPAGGGEGRSLVAYRRSDGTFAWGGGSDPLGYSSPALQTLAGTPQILLFNGRAVVSHDPQDGRVLWRQPWPSPHPKVANPVPLGADTVVTSAGYGQGAEAVRVMRGANGQWTATRVWKSNRLKAKFANFVAHEGNLYGLDDGILTCLDAATGEPRWKDGRYGHGQFILVSSRLLLLAESGELVLVEAVPDGLRELSRVRVFAGKTWNPPALAGDRAFLRNDREAVCLRLPLAR